MHRDEAIRDGHTTLDLSLCELGSLSLLFLLHSNLDLLLMDLQDNLDIIIIIIEKHTSEGAKEQKQHKLSYMVEAEDTIKSNSD